MSTLTSPLRSEHLSGRHLASIVTLAAALVATFLGAPRLVAARATDASFVDRRGFVDAVRGTFVEYWASGDRELPAGLGRVVDFWGIYHATKAVSAALLLLVLVVLVVLLCRAFLRAGDAGVVRRAALAVSIATVSMLALFSLLLTMANVQGSIAPFASLLPTLTPGQGDGALSTTLDQVEQALTDVPSSGLQGPPALEVMVGDFSRFHAVLAAAAAIVVLAFVGLSVALWRRVARLPSSDRRTRRLLASFGLLSALFSLAVLVVALANASTAADPAPALLASFTGGW